MPSRVDAEDLNASNDDQWIVDGWPIDRSEISYDARGTAFVLLRSAFK
jgi:hypothetical protein